MESKTIRRINAAKQIFRQEPIEYERPNIFGIEDTNVAPTQVSAPLQQTEQVAVPEEELPEEVSQVPQVPQDAYQHTEQAALENPNDIAAQQEYNSMTAQKLSGGRKSKLDTEVFLRDQQKQRMINRSKELGLRRKISTDSEKPKY
jgi:hypothetical protein